MKRAIFPGTFDPFTLGHYSIVKRGLDLFDEIVIGIGVNAAKQTLFTLEERLEHIRTCFAGETSVTVIPYEGMTIELAHQQNARFILRGLRTISDFEYEQLLSDVNKRISGIDTVILFTEPEYSCIQSNVVRELIRYGQNINGFVPAPILDLLKK